MKQFVLSLFVLITISTVGQNYNRPVPESLFQYEAQITQSFPGENYLLSPVKLFTNPSTPGFKYPYLAILDENGYLAWYYESPSPNILDFKYHSTIGRYSYTTVYQGTPISVIMNQQLQAVDTIFSSDLQDVHDLQLAENGNWLISTAYFDTIDLSGQIFSGIPGSAQTIVKGYGFEEQTPGGNYVQSWNSNDHLQMSETYDFWGYNPTNFDYCHGNAVEEDNDGNILLSYRHLNSIHKVNRSTGTVMWRLGGELSDFTFTNDNGFSGQHDIRVLSNGTYSLFDNGNMSGVTRSAIYQLDTVNWTATKVDEFIHPISAVSTAMGSYQKMQDNRGVLGYGLTYRPDPNATIIDANNTILSEFIFEDSVVTYRFLASNIPSIDRPTINCSWNGSNWELFVNGNYSNYLWNTGETTSSIQMTQTGEYQAWVNYGIGQVGSYPIVVTDINNPCSAISVEELSLTDTQYVLYDLQGRKVVNPSPFVVYIKVYASGKTEKIVTGE